MVATRRGARVSSPEKSTNDEAAETPMSAIRRTRRRSVMVTTQSQSEQTSDSQQDEAEEQNMAPAKPASLTKRETRGSKCHPTDKQTESTHEADVSGSESCCSVVSDTQLTSQSRKRTSVRGKPTAVADQAASKAESSSSFVKTPRRTTRSQKEPIIVLESTTSQEEEHSEAESCSSVASLSTRVTRSRRKPAIIPEDAAHSGAGLCSSGPQGSTVRRSTRNRATVTEPIPIHWEQHKTTEASAVFEPNRTRGRSGKAKSTEEDQADDSESCHSGPSLNLRRTTRSRVADSDSESVSTAYTSLDSPCSTQDRGTPCSSRTGSASSNRAIRVSRSKSARLALDVPSMSSAISKSVKKDSEENETEKDQAETTEDIPSLSVRTTKFDIEGGKELEEDANNKTIIAADQECSIAEDNNGDQTLIEDEVEMVKPEHRQDISSKTEKDINDVEECRETADEADSVQEVQAMEEESSSSSVMPLKSVTVTEEDESDLSEEPDTEVQQCCDPAKRDENLKVPCEPEKKVKATKEMTDMVADEGAIRIDQGPSEEGVVEGMINEEGPSSSTEACKTSIEKTKPVKGCVSLLDSSEDEESGGDDDDGLSVDGGDDKAGDLESEDEMCCSEDQPGPSSAPDSLMGNGLFIIDTRPGCQPSEKYYVDTTRNEDDYNVKDSNAVEDEEDFIDEEGDDDEDDEDSKVLFSVRKPALNELSSAIDPGLKVKSLGGLYINFDGSKSKSVSDNLKKLKDQKTQDELLKKSVIVADFEKKDTVPPYKESRHATKLKRREERAKTTGDGWFNMRAPELTEELKNDLKALQMRSAIDPKRFYKKNDRQGLPKYFEVGTVVDNPIDFYHSRIPKKERKRTIVEELLADAEFRSFNKRKYREIVAEKAAAAAGKMNKKKHKFHKKK